MAKGKKAAKGGKGNGQAVTVSKAGTLLRKLTAKGIMGTISKPKEPTDLFIVYGVATKVDIKETGFGPSLRFWGDFRATRNRDGAQFRAPVAFLQEPVASMLKNALDSRPDAEKGVEFGFQVSIVPAEGTKERPSQTGYEYRVESLTETVENDVMNQLAAKVLGNAKALTHAA